MKTGTPQPTAEDLLAERAGQLLESEEKYRSLFTQSVSGIYLHDLEGRFLYANPTACLQSGYSREELLRMNVFDLHPVLSDTLNLPKDEILRKWNDWRPEGSHIIRGEHRRKDGTTFPVDISTGIVNIGGQLLVMAIVSDITELKCAEEVLRSSEARYRNLFENAVVGIFLTSPDGHFIDANACLSTLLGFDFS